MISALCASSILLTLGACASPPRTKAVPADPLANLDVVFFGVVDGNAGIYRAAADSENARPQLLVESANWPEPSPDGARLVYQFRSEEGTLDIWAADRDGGNRRPLTIHPAHDYLPSWSPDGKWITFTSWRVEPGDNDAAPHLYIMRSDGSGQRRILAESLGTSTGANWAPDGRAIAFGLRGDEPHSSVYAAPIDSTAETPLGPLVRLTHDERSNGIPVYSPDGRHIAFDSTSDSDAALMVMNADGSNRRVVLEGGYNWYPRWSPDGTRLCFTRALSEDHQNDLDIYEVPADGRAAPRALITLPGRQAEGRLVRRP